MKTQAHRVLADILENGIDVHRCAAARAFATIGGAGATGALVAALLDEDPDVRADAAQSLLAIGDASAAEQLMENLVGDPEPDVKKPALEALIAMRHEPVLPLLRKLAVSRTDDIVWDEDEFYSEGWDSWLDLQLIAIGGLAEFGEEGAVQDILSAMGDEDGQDVSEVGVAALARLGLEGAVALEQLFPISDARLQRRIAEVVMRAANPHAKGQIETFLTHETPRIREIAALGLDPADARLDPLFGDPDPSVRAAVLRHGGVNFPVRVRGMVGDPDPSVRFEVFSIIAADPDRYRDDDLAEALKKAIAGEARAAKQAALALVALRGADAVRGLGHVMGNEKVPLDFRVGAVEALERAGPESVPYLLKGAADGERRLRLAAMTALAGLAAGDPVWPNLAGEGLLAALGGTLVRPPEDEDEEETGVAGKAGAGETGGPEHPDAQDNEVDATTPLVAVPEGSTLGRILAEGADEGGADVPEGDETAPDAPVAAPEMDEQHARLLELSRQRRMSKRKMALESDVAPYLDVRRFAASVLGGVVNAEVAGALVAVLSGPDTELTQDALASLVQHGEQTGSLPQSAAAPLAELFAGAPSDTVRVLALRAIAMLPGGGGEETLRAALADPDPQVRVEAVRGLDRMGIADAAVEAMLDDPYIGVGIAAARSLARHRGAAATDALISFAFMNDGTHRRDIGRLLGEYAPEEGARRLIDLARDDEHLRERLVVIDALAEVIAHTSPDRDRRVA